TGERDERQILGPARIGPVPCGDGDPLGIDAFHVGDAEAELAWLAAAAKHQHRDGRVFGGVLGVGDDAGHLAELDLAGQRPAGPARRAAGRWRYAYWGARVRGG